MLTGYLKSMKVADQSLENPVPGVGSRQADAPRFERNGDGGEDMAILKQSPTVVLESVTGEGDSYGRYGTACTPCNAAISAPTLEI